MTSEEGKEMNRLSKEVFGTSSKWRKLVEGVPETLQRDREVMIPTKYGPIKKVFTDKKIVFKRYTVEEVKQHMVDTLASRENKIVSTARFDQNGFLQEVGVGDTIPLPDGSTAEITQVVNNTVE